MMRNKMVIECIFLEGAIESIFKLDDPLRPWRKKRERAKHSKHVYEIDLEST